jgi:hypothetical protein
VTSEPAVEDGACASVGGQEQNDARDHTCRSSCAETSSRREVPEADRAGVQVAAVVLRDAVKPVLAKLEPGGEPPRTCASRRHV